MDRNNHLQKNNFDFIRFIAAIMVIITHSYVLTGVGVSNDLLFRLTDGQLMTSTFGLAIFFIISGFLITASVLRTKSAWGFIAKRLLRIMPGLLVCVSITALVIGPLVSVLSLSDYFNNMLTWSYFQNIVLYRMQFELPGVFESNISHTVNGSIWTLAYEFSFYMMVLIMYITGIIRRPFMVIVLFILFAGLAVYMHFFTVPDKFFYFLIYTILQLDHFVHFGLLFLAGTIIYLYYELIVFNTKIVLLFLFVLVLSLAFHVFWITQYITLPYLTIFLCFAPLTHWIRGWAKYGDLSYGIYIYGMPVQQLLLAWISYTLHADILSILTVVCILPIAWLSWHLVEKNMLRLKKYV